PIPVSTTMLGCALGEGDDSVSGVELEQVHRGADLIDRGPFGREATRDRGQVRGHGGTGRGIERIGKQADARWPPRWCFQPMMTVGYRRDDDGSLTDAAGGDPDGVDRWRDRLDPVRWRPSDRGLVAHDAVERRGA